MNHGQVAAKLRAEKDAHPERFCPSQQCLWRIRGEHGPLIVRHTGKEARCPAHQRQSTEVTENASR